jgi:hypothetical protein
MRFWTRLLPAFVRLAAGGKLGARALAKAAVYVLAAVLLAGVSQGAPISPTTDLPSSSPVAYTIQRPTGQTWYYSGGTYDLTNATRFLASRNDGIVEKYQVLFNGSGNVTGATLLGTTDLGVSDLQDLVAAPGGYIGAAGKMLYRFDSNLNQVGTLLLTGLTSDLTDLLVFTMLDSSANVPGWNYALFFAT